MRIQIYFATTGIGSEHKIQNTRTVFLRMFCAIAGCCLLLYTLCHILVGPCRIRLHQAVRFHTEPGEGSLCFSATCKTISLPAFKLFPGPALVSVVVFAQFYRISSCYGGNSCYIESPWFGRNCILVLAPLAKSQSHNYQFQTHIPIWPM